jgi:putative membrane protein
MQFLKTLLWVLLAVAVALFASRNWFPVTLNLWGDIQADIKLPALLLLLFLVGFLPTWLTMRAKLWTQTRRLEAMERNRVAVAAEAALPPRDEPEWARSAEPLEPENETR